MEVMGMALYVITFDGAGDTEAQIVDGRANLDARIKEMWEEDYWSEDHQAPMVYQLGKKMTVKIETKIVLEGE
jgi:hypothetical protein